MKPQPRARTLSIALRGERSNIRVAEVQLKAPVTYDGPAVPFEEPLAGHGFALGEIFRHGFDLEPDAQASCLSIGYDRTQG
jgi:hypothetical protein